MVFQARPFDQDFFITLHVLSILGAVLRNDNIDVIAKKSKIEKMNYNIEKLSENPSKSYLTSFFSFETTKNELAGKSEKLLHTSHVHGAELFDILGREHVLDQTRQVEELVLFD